MDTKKCSTCKQFKSLSEFSKNKRQSDGLDYSCKSCRNSQQKAIRQRYPELIARRIQSYKESHRAELAEKSRAYYESHKDQQKENKKRWVKSNPERAKSFRDAYRANNKEAVRQQVRRWFQNNPGKKNAYREKRRAQKLGSISHYTTSEFMALCEKYGNICLCCKQKKPLTADHVIPLSKGGTNDISNIQPLCLSCNCKKHARHIDYR